MKNKVFSYNKEAAFDNAKSFFISASGFDLNKPRHRKMFDDALNIYENERSDEPLKVVCSHFDKDVYQNDHLKINGHVISCNGFSWIKEENVRDIYICTITAGEWSPKKNRSAKAQVYMDIWGTAFADSAKILFEQELQKTLKSGTYLSDPFGPGYYGMPHQDIKKLADIIPMEKIGVEIRSSGIMVPLKSIASVYFITDNARSTPPLACSECFGKIDGCRLCENRPGKQIEKELSI